MATPGPLRREPGNTILTSVNHRFWGLPLFPPTRDSPLRGPRFPLYRDLLTLSESVPYTGRARVSDCHQGHPLAAASITHRIPLRARGASPEWPGARETTGCTWAQRRTKGAELRPRRGDGQDGAGQSRPASTRSGSRRSRTPGRAPFRRTSSQALQAIAPRGTSLNIRIVATVMPFGRSDAAHGHGPYAVRALLRQPRPAHPRDPRVHHQKRAEPQPLLAAAVRAEGRGRGRDGITQAARADVRRDEGSGQEDLHQRRLGLAPRGGDIPGTGRDTHSRRCSSPTWGPPTGAEAHRSRSWTDSRSTRTARTRARRRPSSLRESQSIGLADYDKLVGTARRGLRRDGAEGLEAADLLRRVRRRLADPDREARVLREDANYRDQAVPETTQATYYRQALRDGGMSADGPWVPASSTSPTRTNYDRWQSGLYSPDGTPKSSRAIVKQTMTEIRPGCARAPDGRASGWSSARRRTRLDSSPRDSAAG